MENEPRESDLLAAHLDLVDLSEIEEDNNMDENDSFHASTVSSKGFAVKDYEEKMDNLKKENFNLKLRLYFLQQSNVTLPEGMENFQKQFIELKHENDTLSNDLKEKQDLLQQASIALELLEEEKSKSLSHAEAMVSELQDKVKSLELQNANLQQAVSDMNKSNLGNDTGYADFLGAVDMRDIEMQRKMLEMTQLSEEYQQQVMGMNQEMAKMKSLLKETEAKMSVLQYERDELNDKFKNADSESKQYVSELQAELKEFKEKWASTQCELQDMEQKYNESEEERQKTLKYLTKSIHSIDEERQKVLALEELLESKQSTGISESEAKKDSLIRTLKGELDKTEERVKAVTASELKHKNQEIEELTRLINQLKMNQSINNSTSAAATPRFSFDILYESFNELKFQQAMEIKKQSQKKIDELMQELARLANSKTKESVNQLKEQIAIVVEKQEIADDALNKCADLCQCTLDHLHQLTQFLTLLLQNKDIRESMSYNNLADIQNILDKSIEFSRYSIDGRISALPDLSILGSLINTARNSLSNIREKQAEIAKIDKSIQSTVACDKCDDIQHKLSVCTQEFEELKKVNQICEDEICEYRSTLEARNDEVNMCHEDLKFLKESETEINAMLEDCKNTIQSLQTEKTNITAKLETSEQTVLALEKKLLELEEDMNANWMKKEEHEVNMKKIKDEVVNAEAQTAAIRFELEEIRKMYPKYKLNSTKSSIASEENSENMCGMACNYLEQDQANARIEVSQVMSKLEFSDDKQHLLMTTESSNPPCSHCQKYQVQVRELKKYLQACFEKLQKYTDQKALADRKIQKQLSETENFLVKARGNMESILKSKENKM